MAHALINATPLGMEGGDDFESFLFLDRLAPSAAVFEFVYSPLSTRLLRQAGARGLACLDGLTLLASQAGASWKAYTGKEPKGLGDIEKAARALLGSGGNA